MDKGGVIDIKWYYSAIKNNKILPFVTTWVDLEGIMLSELSEKDKYCMISFICGILKKKGKWTENRLVVARGERVEQRAKWGRGSISTKSWGWGSTAHVTIVKNTLQQPPSYPWGIHPKTLNGCLKPHTEPYIYIFFWYIHHLLNI